MRTQALAFLLLMCGCGNRQDLDFGPERVAPFIEIVNGTTVGAHIVVYNSDGRASEWAYVAPGSTICRPWPQIVHDKGRIQLKAGPYYTSYFDAWAYPHWRWDLLDGSIYHTKGCGQERTP